MRLATRASTFRGRGESMRRLAALIAAIACVLLLTSCSLISGLLGSSDDRVGQVVRDTMAHIIEAINDRDAAALRAMFTDYARAEYSAEIDEGVAHLLSLFPNGDVIWEDDGEPAGGGSGSIEHGKESWLGGTSDVVSSAGKKYTLSFSVFTRNTIDPENVGVFRISLNPWTESGVSGAELASCGSIGTDPRKGAPPGVFISDSGEKSHERAVAIVDALNAHDAAALKSMFTEYARTTYSAQIDQGLTYLLSLFPDGEVTLGGAPGGSAVCQRIMGDTRTVLLPTYYTVRSGGVDYRLFFADFIENTIDPTNVGIYAMGATRAAECGRCGREADLNTWADDFYVGASTRPGVFIDQNDKADAQMERIAGALNNHDAAALKRLFSRDVRDKSPDLDKGVDYLLSLFPKGGITWIQDPAEINPVDSGSYIKSGKLTEWLHGTYKLSAAGNDYWLYFSSVTVDEGNPDGVGLDRLGATPWVKNRSTDGMSGRSEQFYDWVNVTITDKSVDHNRVIFLPR